jgi:thiol-disulfide isomerase/thioredoxin
MKSIKLSPSSKSDFDKKLKDGAPILFLFYANWCRHCHEFQPEWAKVKSSLGRKQGIHIVEVESASFDLLPDNLKNIAAFPTVQMVKDGKFCEEFRGNRLHDELVTYALKFVDEAPKRKRATTSSSSLSPKSPKKAPVPRGRPRKPLKGKRSKVM